MPTYLPGCYPRMSRHMVSIDQLRNRFDHMVKIGREEERNRVSLLACVVHDAVAGRDVEVIRHGLQLVAHVDDICSGLGRCRDPLTSLVRDLKGANRTRCQDGKD